MYLFNKLIKFAYQYKHKIIFFKQKISTLKTEITYFIKMSIFLINKFKQTFFNS